MKVEVVVLGFSSLIVLMVSVDVKQHSKKMRNCVKVEVAVQGSPSLIVRTVSVKQQRRSFSSVAVFKTMREDVLLVE